MNYFLIAIGAAIGGISRYAMQGWVYSLAERTFPYGTLAVNVTGSLMIGLVLHLADERLFLSPETKLFLTVGFCGGFTTFSSFAFETFALLREAAYFEAALYIVASNVLCLVSIWVGDRLGKLF